MGLSSARLQHLLGIMVFVSVLVATLGLSGTAYAITNGHPDGGRHPYVGLLVFDDEMGPAWRCTGSLISPTVVLCAGHCTDGAVAARVWFDEVVEGNPDYHACMRHTLLGRTKGSPFRPSQADSKQPRAKRRVHEVDCQPGAGERRHCLW